MLKLKFKVDGLHKLDGLSPQARADVLNAAAGRVRAAVEAHFLTLPGRNFWQEAADDVVVTPSVTAQKGKRETVQAEVQIRKRGVALRYYGGTVQPSGNISELTGKPIKSLLLPGKELKANGGDLYDFVRDPSKVYVLKKRGGRVLLMEDMGKGTPPRLLGRLVKLTKHRPNKKVLPTRTHMKDEARKGAMFILQHIQKKKKP